MASKRHIPQDVAKLLWGRSDHRCAICDDGSEIVPLQMAHQLSHSPKGPRAQDRFGEFARPIDGDINEYENLILLCPNHHLRTDRNDCAGFWSVKRVKLVKRFHEEYWAFRKKGRCGIVRVGDLSESRALYEATQAATRGDEDAAIDAYLTALAEGMSKRTVWVVVVSAVSISPLLVLKAGGSGSAFAETCCSRAIDLCRCLDEPDRSHYERIGMWSQAHGRLKQPDSKGEAGPVTREILNMLKGAGFYRSSIEGMPTSPTLPYPTIIAGETARCHLGQQVSRIQPTQMLYFSPRYLATYLYHEHRRREAADLLLSQREQLSRVYDGEPNLCLAAMERRKRPEAMKHLSRFEEKADGLESPLDKAEARASIACLQHWIGNSKARGSRDRRELDKVIAAASERYVAGNAQLGSPGAEAARIWSTPWLQALRDCFPDIRDLDKALRGESVEVVRQHDAGHGGDGPR